MRRVVSPLPAALEPVNVYVLQHEEGLALIDTGIRSKKSRALLAEQLAPHGGIEAITHIFLTHGHVDHYGAAATLGGRVLAHEDTVDRVSRPFEPIEPLEHPAAPFFGRLGVPEVLIKQMISIENYMGDAMASPVRVDQTLSDGERIELPPYRFQVIETPGHCPGHIGLLEENHGWFFCGDQLHRDRLPVCPLALYPATTFELGELALSNPRDTHWASLNAVPSKMHYLPGHGEAFDDVETVVSRYRTRILEREQTLLEACRTPMDLYGLSRALFDVNADVVTLLTVSETLYGAMSALRRGALLCEERSGVVHFETRM